MDLWLSYSYDLDSILQNTTNSVKNNSEITTLKTELINFKTEVQPWLQEINDIKTTKLELIRNFVNIYVINNCNDKLNVKEFNSAIVKYVYTMSSLMLKPTIIKGLMEIIFNKSKNNSNFWYKKHKDYFYKELR